MSWVRLLNIIPSTVTWQVYWPASDRLREEKERVGPASESMVSPFLHWYELTGPLAPLTSQVREWLRPRAGVATLSLICTVTPVAGYQREQ